jgi:hypothetical protein
MSTPSPSSGSDVHGCLLQQCAPLTFDWPWDFLRASAACRFPVTDPAATLALLATKFTPEALEAAQVTEPAGHGHRRLRPELCNPTETLIGVRLNSSAEPYGIMTSRCIITEKGWRGDAILADTETVQRARETQLFFAPVRLREVALLRTLGLAATSAFCFRRLSPQQLVAVNRRFTGRDFALDEESPAAVSCHEQQQPELVDKPALPAPDNSPLTLVLVAWAPLAITDRYCPLLAHIAQQLVWARKFLGLPLAGIRVWQPSHAFLENLRYRIQFEDVDLVRDLMLESADELHDFEPLAAALSPGSQVHQDFVSARANLLRRYADNEPGGEGVGPSASAVATYREAVRRELTDPLRAWALASHDPVTRNAIVELASRFEMLHQAGPALHEHWQRILDDRLPAHVRVQASRLFDQYLKLSSSTGSAMKTLHHWSR